MDTTRRRGPYKKYLRSPDEQLPRETRRRWQASADTPNGSNSSLPQAGPSTSADNGGDPPLCSSDDSDSPDIYFDCPDIDLDFPDNDLDCSDIDTSNREEDSTSDTGASSDIGSVSEPAAPKLQDLARNGLKWRHPETGQIVVSYIKAPLSSVDAVARAMLQGIRQFNALHSPHRCNLPAFVGISVS
ncbi:uncharacterized protein LOC119377622 [Rhipicephalus sanguineus]|uniref:uncharacterized protein LOC119377622 n=1 Tax=Rhipicephalus sanguineus TaxID=34632 RepID=UPI0020C4DC45|nr:uncharacterized protein LOC119377622 [Rhipicephalus sanguineus]